MFASRVFVWVGELTAQPVTGLTYLLYICCNQHTIHAFLDNMYASDVLECFKIFLQGLLQKPSECEIYGYVGFLTFEPGF